MGLTRSPDRIRLSDDDPCPAYLENKVLPGPGIKITRKTNGDYGNQAVISAIGDGQGSFGDVVTVNQEGFHQVSCHASLVLVSSANGPVDLVLPHPSEVLHWISVVCVDKTNDIRFHTTNEDDKILEPEEGVVVDSRTFIFDVSNIEFQAAGDSLVFASNRHNTWYCVAKYAACWYA